MLHHIGIKDNADYASAIDTGRRLITQGNPCLWFKFDVDYEGISHFTNANFTDFADQVLSDPALMECISRIDINLDLFRDVNAPTPQQFGQFLGSILNFSELNLYITESGDQTPTTNLQVLAALLGVTSGRNFSLKRFQVAGFSPFKLEGSTQDFIDFAGVLAANQGLTHVGLCWEIHERHNTADKLNPMLKAIASLPFLSDLILDRWIPPHNCREDLALVCAGSKLESLSLHSHGFSMAFAAIKESTSLQKLTVSHLNLQQERPALAELLHTNMVVKELICWSYIAPLQEEEVLCQLAEDLKGNSTITKLCLHISIQDFGHRIFQKKMVEMLRDNTTITWLAMPTVQRPVVKSCMTDDMKYFLGLNQLDRKNWSTDQTTLAACLGTLMSAREKQQDFHNGANTLKGELGALNITYEVLHLMPAIWTNSDN